MTGEPSRKVKYQRKARMSDRNSKKAPYAWRSPFENYGEVIEIARGLFEACETESEVTAVKHWLLSTLISRGHFVPEEIYPCYIRLRNWMVPEGADVRDVVVTDMLAFFHELDENYKMLRKGQVAPGIAVHCLTRVMSQELWKGNASGFIAIFNELYDMMGMSGKIDAWEQYRRERALKDNVKEAAAEIVQIEAIKDKEKKELTS